MVYSDRQIRDAIERGHIVCHPLHPDSVRGSSVDVTLGEHFYIVDQLQNQAGYNPFSKADIERYFQPKRAILHRTWSDRHKGMRFEGIPDDHPIIVLNPRQRILAHTHEFIGILPPGTSEMRARSTWGRNGIVVCKDAGWGDPGYIGRWTMEIQNDNDEAVPLPVGERIAQIVFHETGEVGRHYGDMGKYQQGHDIRKLVREWSPEMMLPRSWQDERRLPLSLDVD